jgi:hypothetical protein
MVNIPFCCRKRGGQAHPPSRPHAQASTAHKLSGTDWRRVRSSCWINAGRTAGALLHFNRPRKRPGPPLCRAALSNGPGRPPVAARRPGGRHGPGRSAPDAQRAGGQPRSNGAT